MKESYINRGDIYYVSLDPVVGSEQGGTRPCLILQNNLGNLHSPTVIVAPITGRPKKRLPTHLSMRLPGHTKTVTILLEQLRTVDKQRLSEYVTRLPYGEMKRVGRIMGISLGIIGLEGVK